MVDLWRKYGWKALQISVLFLVVLGLILAAIEGKVHNNDAPLYEVVGFDEPQIIESE